MSYIRITDGVNNRDIELQDKVVNEGAKHIVVGSKYLELTQDMNTVIGTPTISVDVDEEVFYPRDIHDNRILYDIAFNGNWTPTEKFNEVFEFINDDGTVASIASTVVTKYRFKSYKEYTGIADVDGLFMDCTRLTGITFPYPISNISCTDVFTGCTNLTDLTFRIDPSQWSTDIFIGHMFRDVLVRNENPLMDISFSGDWIPTAKFDHIFELVDPDGYIVNTATPVITTYRFKLNKENYTSDLNVNGMFQNCPTLTSIVLPDDWGNLVDASQMFSGCTALTSVGLPETWGKLTNTTCMFQYCSSLSSITLPSDWGSVTIASQMFRGCSSLPSIQLPLSWKDMTDVSWLLSHCTRLSSIVLPSNWGNVINAYQMLNSCSTLVNITLPSNWGGVSNTSDMFVGTGFTAKNEGIKISEGYYKSPTNMIFPIECWKSGLGLNAIPEVNDNALMSIAFNGNWTPTSKFNEVFELVNSSGEVVSMASTSIKLYRFKLNKENYTGVTSLTNMFYGCTTLTSISLPSVWNRVTATNGMFQGCTSLTSIVLPQNWGIVSNTTNMFYGCSKLVNITLPSNWSGATSRGQMFNGTGFTTKDKGILVAAEYYRSSANTVFPLECWVSGVGLDHVVDPNVEVEYRIAFNGNWFPSPKFNEVFELLFDDFPDLPPGEYPIYMASIHTRKYRFKKGMENYGNITHVTSMFEGCATLTHIELPPTWGRVTDSSLMFFGCSSLIYVALPSNWGTNQASGMMFHGTGFAMARAGILVSEGYYKSPLNSIFPLECWKENIGLSYLA